MKMILEMKKITLRCCGVSGAASLAFFNRIIKLSPNTTQSITLNSKFRKSCLKYNFLFLGCCYWTRLGYRPFSFVFLPKFLQIFVKDLSSFVTLMYLSLAFDY